MVKIINIEEFENIIKSNYGYMIIKNKESVIIHETKCIEINKEKFSNSENEDTEFHWFSTISLAEKKFTDIKNCKICNPD
ncbi:MAG: hypothetical protein DWQ18_04365 [Crenarchaeota archaeon]|nr:MAG: hypothetical protein DWQ17_08765 [Thermoproteota archaeon]RDJ34139.1 MAG: hypothetical protein DWQ18_04365 [Thermoproteota archaeon]RDJ36745.1 MAG: hypothetical protein DWQ13_06245 [Thermoproteota archaeon]RDJ37721.1 MAG: hypothetical protein DWQ19_04590 [Thermoproteota archaeon]